MKYSQFIMRGFIFVSLVLISSGSFGQIQRLRYNDEFTTYDTARYEITYNVKKVVDPSKLDNVVVDIQKLQIGKRMSKTFSYLQFQNDSLCTILENGDSDFPSPPVGADNREIFKDFRTGELRIRERVDGTQFCYEENKPEFNWVIQNRHKVIASYPCQCASVTFRGRQYEVWFTPAIPVSAGPFKFGGLPGLILEVQDSKHHYTFTCIGLKKMTTLFPIKSQNFPCTTTTREALSKFQIKRHSNPTQYYNSMGVTYATKKDGKLVINPKNLSWPYNPIELE